MSEQKSDTRFQQKNGKKLYYGIPTVRLPKENMSEVVIKGYEMKPMVLKYK